MGQLVTIIDDDPENLDEEGNTQPQLQQHQQEDQDNDQDFDQDQYIAQDQNHNQNDQATEEDDDFEDLTVEESEQEISDNTIQDPVFELILDTIQRSTSQNSLDINLDSLDQLEVVVSDDEDRDLDSSVGPIPSTEVIPPIYLFPLIYFNIYSQHSPIDFFNLDDMSSMTPPTTTDITDPIDSTTALINVNTNSSAGALIRSQLKGTETNEKFRRRLLPENSIDRRLSNILCCSICLEIPRDKVYQCKNGHLLCETCLERLLADAHLKDQISSCPSCRVSVGKHNIMRNLAVELAATELKSECRYCSIVCAVNRLNQHEQYFCEERPVCCKYYIIGCIWQGPLSKKYEHESTCIQPTMYGPEAIIVGRTITEIEERTLEHMKSVVDLLSFNSIVSIDLTLKGFYRPQRNEDHRVLEFETSRFKAFSYQWVVQAKIVNQNGNPNDSPLRWFEYALILETPVEMPFTMFFFATKGPSTSSELALLVNRFTFSKDATSSLYSFLPLRTAVECNKVMANKSCALRFYMFTKDL